MNIIDRLLQNAADRTKPNDGRPRSERATPIANLLYDAADRITSLERRLVAMTTDRDERRLENLGFSNLNGKLHVRARELTERAEKAEAEKESAEKALLQYRHPLLCASPIQPPYIATCQTEQSPKGDTQ